MQNSDVPAEPFASLDGCCYMRRATMDGRLGWVMYASDGDKIGFTEIRSEVFFEAARRELRLMLLN